MKKEQCYENYPCWIVFISNLFQIVIYAAGAHILFQLGLAWLIVYLAYIVFLEIMLLKRSCANCYYHGKHCAFGKGKLSGLFFRRGSTKRFTQLEMTWKDIIPGFLVSLIPIVTGIVLLILKFNWLLLTLVILLFILTSAGNAFVRGKLACKYCKQRKIGCPAEKLFNKRKN